MSNIKPRGLISTKRCQEWLSQFKPEDREIAEKIIKSLTLISHNEFNRSIQKLLNKQAQQNEVTAFFVAREIKPFGNYFELFYDKDKKRIDALDSGSDHGSEALMASIIRNYCENNPNIFLNHPTLEEMKERKCRSVVIVDDFIGTGGRISTVLSSLWVSKTIRSWFSSKLIKFSILAYAGTDNGLERVINNKRAPTLNITRSSPSFYKMPLRRMLINKIEELCRNYGRKTYKKSFSLGFKKSMASIVFEHRCPNNAPAILWAENRELADWKALFPYRNVDTEERSVFPNEVSKPNPTEILEEIGQYNLARSSFLQKLGDHGDNIIMILALVSQGRRRKSALSFATGLDEGFCAEALVNCIEWGFISPTYRITDKGKAELKAARTFKSYLGNIKKTLPDLGEDYYYPKQLRGITND